jgi:isopentenyl-diphosphate Delta-isomerase
MGVLPDVLGAAPRPALEGVGESGLQRFRLAYRALPGRDLREVSLRTRLLGAELSAPVVLVGDDRPLARVATEHGLGLVANRLSPDRPPLWLASLDVTELRVAGGPERAEQLVSSLDADGLVLRLNGMDEALREDGQPLMRHATEAIASVAERLRPLPVVVCGTGFGMDAADVRELRAAGVSAIDVGGGSGGSWGVSTADALAEGVLAADGLPLLAGVHDGIDAAKCLALGAVAVSVAWPRPDGIAALVERLRVAVWATGEPAASLLTQGHLRDA